MTSPPCDVCAHVFRSPVPDHLRPTCATCAAVYGAAGIETPTELARRERTEAAYGRGSGRREKLLTTWEAPVVERVGEVERDANDDQPDVLAGAARLSGRSIDVYLRGTADAHTYLPLPERAISAVELLARRAAVRAERAAGGVPERFGRAVLTGPTVAEAEAAWLTTALGRWPVDRSPRQREAFTRWAYRGGASLRSIARGMGVAVQTLAEALAGAEVNAVRFFLLGEPDRGPAEVQRYSVQRVGSNGRRVGPYVLDVGAVVANLRADGVPVPELPSEVERSSERRDGRPAA